MDDLIGLDAQAAEKMDLLNKMSKDQIIEVVRALNNGRVGDTGRISKGEYINQLCANHSADAVIKAAQNVNNAFTQTKAALGNNDAAKQLADALALFMPAAPEVKLDADMVRDIVREELATVKQTVLTVKKLDGEGIELGAVHKNLAELITICSAGLNVFLAGAAGSGKTTAAEQVAKALGLDFFMNGAIDTEYKLKGFIDAQGRLVSTAFRQAYEQGGLYLFDEVDASMPSATMAFNAALANGFCDFPDGRVMRHEKFICIAAGNTYGMGATFEYVGRNKQDAAFLDRFVFMGWDIDEALELGMTANKTWAKYVQGVRAKAASKGLKVVISPRTTIYGAKLLAAGVDVRRVEELTIKKGMTAEQWASLN